MRHYLLILLFVCACFAAQAQHFDIHVLRDINQHRNTDLDGTMKGFTNSVTPITIGVPAVELLFGYVRRDKDILANGWEDAEGLALNTVLTFGLKYAVNRSRPYETYTGLQPDHYAKDPSFPSAHTSYAFYTATSLAIHYRLWYITAPAYAWAATVGYSRMHLGMHYPSDVLFGAVLGAASSWVTYRANIWLRDRKEDREMMR